MPRRKPLRLLPEALFLLREKDFKAPIQGQWAEVRPGPVISRVKSSKAETIQGFSRTNPLKVRFAVGKTGGRL